MRRLNENQRWSLINALRAAADQSAEFAQVQARVAGTIRSGVNVALYAEGEPGAQAAEALSAQFAKQKNDYLTLAGEIEEAEYIEFGDPDVLAGEGESDHHDMLTGEAEPCCYGFITSGGQVHEPGCHRFGRR